MGVFLFHSVIRRVVTLFRFSYVQLAYIISLSYVKLLFWASYK